MRHHNKRHSWPPLHKSRLLDSTGGIDADPFAYFISPLEDTEMDAGIKTKPRSRSLPPVHHRPRRPLSTSRDRSSPTAKLKRWIDRMEKQYFRRTSSGAPPPEVVIIEPKTPPPTNPAAPIVIPRSPPVRGRRDARSTSSHRVAVNGRTPPRRPHVWREPSAEIWSVAEEEEKLGLGRMAAGQDSEGW